MIPYANNIRPSFMKVPVMTQSLPKKQLSRIDNTLRASSLGMSEDKAKKSLKASRLMVCIGQHIRTMFESAGDQDIDQSFYFKIIYKRIQQVELLWAHQDIKKYDKTLAAFEKVHQKMIVALPKRHNINTAVLVMSLYDYEPNEFRNYTGLSDFNFKEMREQSDTFGLDREVETNEVVDMFIELMRKELRLKAKEKVPVWAKSKKKVKG